MLLDVGCTYVLVGHSERRQLFGESDAMVNKRARGALAAGLRPIVCIGETLAERDSGRTLSVVAAQLAGSLADVSPDEMARKVAGYRAEGYRRFQLKVGSDPDVDIERIRAVRAALARPTPPAPTPPTLKPPTLTP